MGAQTEQDVGLEIAHVLFIDIVGYSKLLTNEQREKLEELNRIVGDSGQVRSAGARGKLLRIPTGDGMALVFFTSPDAPARCAISISRALRHSANLPVRMGIHSGPVDRISHVDNRPNLAGAGVNMAQRVMNCGDAGHILLSRRSAEDLAQYAEWKAQLHDLGDVEVKHGARIGIVSLYTEEAGNPELPRKLRQQRLVRRRRIIVASSAALLMMGLVIGLLIYQRQTKLRTQAAAEATAAKPNSVAVLPFENLSEDKDNAYFAAGVQDEILSDLARIADLKVISRTSVMKYKTGSERNLREIAKALGVSHVVEGSVQRAGGRVRVNAQLIDARNDTHVWAEHYDRDVADIFAIQTEIAERIADQLRANLSAAENAAITKRPTADLVAYAYYTKARELDLSENWEGDEKNLNQKVELLEKATQRDPNFALAYCEVAKTQVDLCSMTGEPDNRKHLELAKQAAEAALRVRPDLAEAHMELARYYFYAGTLANDYGAAREQLAIVRRSLPNNAEALTIEARIGRHENRWDTSLADLQKAYELDPGNGDIAFYLGQIYFEMRRYSQLEEFLKRRVANRTVDDLGAKIHLAQIKLAEADPITAQSFLDQLPLDYSPGPWIWNTRFTAALYLRNFDAADRIIAATPAKWADFAFEEQTSASAEGEIARARGDKEKALAAFATARKKLEATFPDEAHDAMYLSQIATLDAGLGQKQDAIHQAQRAVELQPIAKESLNGTILVTKLALVYAWSGEPDRAIEQLEIVATIPKGPSYGDLRLNPCWDALRGDPRFQKIVAAARSVSRIAGP